MLVEGLGIGSGRMSGADPSFVVVAQGALGRMRELAGHLAEAGIASEVVPPGPGSRHG